MVVLIRHAQSTWNASGDTSPNVPITPLGISQSSSLGGSYDIVVCSTMKRARQTLDSSNIVYGEVVFTPLCREVLDGNPSNLYNGEENVNETEEQIMGRIELFKQLVRELERGDKTVAVITHYCFLHKLTGYAFGNCNWMGYTV